MVLILARKLAVLAEVFLSPIRQMLGKYPDRFITTPTFRAVTVWTSVVTINLYTML
jgi:hypothetical protein